MFSFRAALGQGTNSTCFIVFDKSGPFEPVVHSTVVRAHVVAGVENWKQELERTCEQHAVNLALEMAFVSQI